MKIPMDNFNGIFHSLDPEDPKQNDHSGFILFFSLADRQNREGEKKAEYDLHVCKIIHNFC